MSHEPLLTSVVGSHAHPGWFVAGIAAAERGEFGPADLAEMIGSSRPVVGRVLTELAEDGEIGRRERKYILLSGGAIEGAVKGVPHIQNGHVPPSIQPAPASRQSIPFKRQHHWGRQ